MEARASDQGLTFREIYEEWLPYKQKMVKPTTLSAYLLLLHKGVLPHFGEMRHIREEDVQAYIYKMMGEHGSGKKHMIGQMTTLRDVIRYGNRKGLCHIDMNWELEYPTEQERKRDKALSSRDHKKLLTYLLEEQEQKYLGILISLCTGMRMGEVCGLQWGDINFKERTITIERTLGCVYDVLTRTSRLVASTPKTKNSYREIPIPMVLLRELKAFRPKGKCEGLYVLTNTDSPFNPRGYRTEYTRLLRQLKIPHVKFHGLRHSFATRCIESGVDPKTLSAILGHANVAITFNLYVHPSHAQKGNAMDKMLRGMMGKPKGRGKGQETEEDEGDID